MQQHTRRLAVFFVASMLTGVALLVACDTDSNTVQPLPGGGSSSSSGKPPGTSGSQSGDDDDTTTPDDDSGTTKPDGGGGGADCGTAPRLRKTELGFFCGFFRDGGADAGGSSNCSNTETCCNPGKDTAGAFPLSWCAGGTKNNNGATKCENSAEAYGSQWFATGGTTWECGSATNCGGKKCCAYSFPGADAGNYINVGKFSGDSPPPASCNAQTIYKIAGTKCATACKDDKSELELCSLTDDCPQGKTCMPARGSGSRDLGYCK